MSLPPLSDSRLKINRARDLIDQFAGQINLYIGRRPYRVFERINPQSGNPDVMLELTEPIPDLLWQLSGDIMANLHQSLDCIAAALAGQNGHPDDKGTYFPVGDDLAALNSIARTHLRAVSQAARDVIVGCGPYKHGPAHALWAIKHLSTKNKHYRYPGLAAHNRGLYVLTNTPVGPTWSGCGGQGVGYMNLPLVLFPNTPISSFLDIEVGPAIVFSDEEPAQNWVALQLFEQALTQAGVVLRDVQTKFF